MAINVGGLVSVIVFYLVVLAVGIWAGWKHGKKSNKETGTESVMLAGRNMGVFVGIMTMTATWVDGGYIMGSAEVVFTSGVVWCQAPFGYAVALFLGGLFFAGPMRSAGYHTMLDPFQEKYGAKIGGVLYLPALCGEILWSSAILASLGSTLSVILGLDNTISVLVSASVAMLYTLFGGLYSVAYTDVVQLFCVAFGLILCVPFAWSNPAVDMSSTSPATWGGTIETHNIGVYTENYLLLIMGGIPWQVYFQRVLAFRTPKQAQTMSYVAGLGSILMAAPPILLGVVATATDWSIATNGSINVTAEENGKIILPLVLQYLTPAWVSYVGLGAVSAAAMSSADSSMLSSSSMFARNIYQAIFFPLVSERHVVRVIWVAIVVVAALASLVALTVNSIYGLFVLSADLVYVLLFPQLLLIIHWKAHCNSYGSIVSMLTGFIFRILGGEPLLGLPVVLAYPYYDPELGQLFPFRTLCMIIALVSHMFVSLLASWMFKNNYVPVKWDVLHCFDAADKSCASPPVRQVSNILDGNKSVDDKFRCQLRSNSSDATLSAEEFELTTTHQGQINPTFTLS
ncbi:high-affinity choline transporter 1 [Daphnia magna]|uniref:high-affinity choline transporter 1 n=1 Tax=Daphnia magna TaxID=35525 RepID=UPI001E1BA48E|nr:high-affinity choline transporter 1 [Daphnia magna]